MRAGVAVFDGVTELRFLGAILFALLLASAPADATVYTATFSGVSNGGTGSAVLTFDDGGGSRMLTVRLDNTSPNTLNNGTGVNSAAITGFGFSSTPNLPGIASWSAYSGTGVNLTNKYSLSYNQGFGGSGGGVAVEDLFRTTNGIHGGIYNAEDPGNTSNLYPDIAVFEIEFCVPFTLAQIDVATLRMQRVGNNGSLKLLGLIAAQTANQVPEPGSAAILGLGLITVIVGRHRRKQKKTEGTEA